MGGELEIVRWLADAGATAILIAAIWFLVTERVVTKGRLADQTAMCERERADDQAELDRLRAELAETQAATKEMAKAALEALRQATKGPAA